MSESSARAGATIFTLGIHAALIAALVVSVAWKQTPKPVENVLSAELFSRATVAPPPVPVPAPAPPPPPPLHTEQEKSPVAPKVVSAVKVPEIAPKVPSAQIDADIALKKKKETERKEKEREIEKAEKAQKEKTREKEKRDALLAEAKAQQRKDADRDAQMREMLAQADSDKSQVNRDLAAQVKARDDVQRKNASEKALREADALAQDEAAKAAQRSQQRSAAETAARARALGEYEAKIRAKVRGNLVYAQELAGNPVTVVEITQLPTGEVISANVRRSSGSRMLDEAVVRAVQKSSPLPKPDQADLFQRTIILQVRPND